MIISKIYQFTETFKLKKKKLSFHLTQIYFKVTEKFLKQQLDDLH